VKNADHQHFADTTRVGAGNETPCVPSSRDLERERQFWIGQFYAGLAAYVGVCSILAVYVLLTLSQPHRLAIAILILVGIAYSSVFYRFRHQVVASHYRAFVFGSGSFVAFSLLAPICLLDGGITSPVIYLFFATLAYQAIGYSLGMVLICGPFCLAAYGFLAWFGSSSVVGFQPVMQMTALCITFVITLIGAAFRDRKDRELHQLRLQLEVMASTDSLTGCLNNHAFRQLLDREAAHAARHGHVLSLLLIDIDYFKQVNDRHGHLVGDEVLRRVGGVMRSAARQGDWVARPGGDELALVAPCADREAALKLAERLKWLVLGIGLSADITLSIGVCSMVPDNGEGAELFRRADQALYQVKSDGRNGIAFCSMDGRLSPSHLAVASG
jgi:diguanylate cyclase (GGDEF)-like protein